MSWQEAKGTESQSHTHCLNFLKWLICMMPRQMGHWSPAFQIMQNSSSHCGQLGAVSTQLHQSSPLVLVCDRLHPCISTKEEPGGPDKNPLPGLDRVVKGNSHKFRSLRSLEGFELIGLSAWHTSKALFMT